VCRWHATYCWKDLNESYNFASISPQLEVFTQSYEPPKSQKSKFREFQDFNLEVLRQNDIWVLGLWSGTNNTIRGRWWLPSSIGHGESCESMFAHGSFVHQKCSNFALTKLCNGTNYHFYAFYLSSTIEITYISVIQYHFGLHGDCSQEDMLQNVETREKMPNK
jgi:hypothetical protein